MTTLKVGIASYADMKARTIAIASGELKPQTDDPKVWFTSPESFAKLLSNRNRALLAQIAETHRRYVCQSAVTDCNWSDDRLVRRCYVCYLVKIGRDRDMCFGWGIHATQNGRSLRHRDLACVQAR